MKALTEREESLTRKFKRLLQESPVKAHEFAKLHRRVLERAWKKMVDNHITRQRRITR